MWRRYLLTRLPIAAVFRQNRDEATGEKFRTADTVTLSVGICLGQQTWRDGHQHPRRLLTGRLARPARASAGLVPQRSLGWRQLRVSSNRIPSSFFDASASRIAFMG
jgi:hypothetical protein